MKKRPGCAASLSDKESDGTRQKFPVLSLTNTAPLGPGHRIPTPGCTYTYSLTLGLCI
jgi:hypothetical protein